MGHRNGGRKPKPTALKLLQGNPGHRPLPKNEAQPKVITAEEATSIAVTESEEAPSLLSDEARAYWPEIARELALVGVLTTMDRPMLWQLVEAMADYVHARNMVDVEGHTTQTVHGGEQVSPWVRIKWKAREHLIKLLTEFGMSPSSRARVQVVNKPKKANKFESMRGGQAA